MFRIQIFYAIRYGYPGYASGFADSSNSTVAECFGFRGQIYSLLRLVKQWKHLIDFIYRDFFNHADFLLGISIAFFTLLIN
jgi:hypothetical protein